MEATFDAGLVKRSIARAGLALALTASAAAQVTSILSTQANGQPTTKDGFDPVISQDGRFVAFFSYADLIGDGPEFVHSDVYLRDRFTGAIERISLSSNEVPGNSFSYAPALTPDLRYVAFSGYASNLVPGDTNGPYPEGHDVFVRDRVAGTTERISVATSGAEANGLCYAASISDDGRFVAFVGVASNLVGGDTNGADDIFVRDRVAGTTERVSVATGGAQADGGSAFPALSADGRLVAFTSLATNLVPGDTNDAADVFVHDRQSGTTQRVSLDSSGAQGDGASDGPAFTPDGRWVAFRSAATNLVPGDTNGVRDIFVHDRQGGTTERVSVGPAGAEADGASATPCLTPDARFVGFKSDAANLVAGDTNGFTDVFVHDRLTGITRRMSVGTDGTQGDDDSGVAGPSISADGRSVAFDSRAHLVATDTDGWHDVYVRERRYEPLASLCSPGADGVVACPCANPPGSPERGCDNSAATGGARLAAAGVAYLAQDSLVLSTTGQRPSALSMVLQGDAALASGAVFGQGVRCLDGQVTRLYVKSAAAGSITAPDLGAGDPTISARSAARGDTILPGETRWYLVFYRDPTVLGGCPATSAFNATQTGRVLWMP